MKIGIVGLGKLGMPVALAINMKGHDIMGHDIRAEAMTTASFAHREVGPNGEPSIEPMLKESTIKFGSIDEVVKHAEIIFVAVQTPHDVRYEGITRIPDDRKDFSYDWLKSATKNLSDAIEKNGEDRVVIIISTVLPGTLDREILPQLCSNVKLCYNPFFIAMGTTMRDFYHPEFILFGVVDEAAAKKAEEFYRTITDAPFYKTSLQSAEMIKVSYNTYIGMKIAFANTIMEICHKLPNVDCDEVTNALAMAGRRLMSGAYLSGGMGDGGGCHPRDNIALSWLAREKDLSFDWYHSVMMAREEQTAWLAKLMLDEKYKDLPKVILGKSFKPETNLTVGSPAILLKNIIEEKGETTAMFDPHIDGDEIPEFAKKKSLFFIGTKHSYFATFDFPEGSVVLDPHRYIQDREGVTVIRIGASDSMKN